MARVSKIIKCEYNLDSKDYKYKGKNRKSSNKALIKSKTTSVTVILLLEQYIYNILRVVSRIFLKYSKFTLFL